jgi:cell division septum initiation protein DivIVA
MKVDYEELMQYYEAARNKTPGEWKDAIEAILDAVPDIVKEHEQLEAENADLQAQIKELSNHKREHHE